MQTYYTLSIICTSHGVTSSLPDQNFSSPYFIVICQKNFGEPCGLAVHMGKIKCKARTPTAELATATQNKSSLLTYIKQKRTGPVLRRIPRAARRQAAISIKIGLKLKDCFWTESTAEDHCQFLILSTTHCKPLTRKTGVVR